MNSSLNNIENYKDNIEYTIKDVNTKYTHVLIEYLTDITKNHNYSKFIIIRGIETITHTFKYILYYTNNLDLTYHHSLKALYLYIEFITQITKESNVFLQLNSRDALTYVYKKTIFELDRVYCKDICNSNKNSEKIKQINEFIELSTSIICFIINNEDLNKDVIRIINNVIDNINSKTELCDYAVFSLFIQKLNIHTIKLNKYVDIINLFFKKLNVNIINKHNLIQMNLNIENIENYSTDKLVTLLFTN
jgi:hypothetical protein